MWLPSNNPCLHAKALKHTASCARTQVRICIYVCEYMYIYICVCMSLCIYIYMCVYMCIHTYVCMYIHIYIYVHVYSSRCLRLSLFTFRLPTLLGPGQGTDLAARRCLALQLVDPFPSAPSKIILVVHTWSPKSGHGSLFEAQLYEPWCCIFGQRHMYLYICMCRYYLDMLYKQTQPHHPPKKA